MSTPASASASDQQDRVRRLRRWTWILIGLAFVLMAGAGGALKIAPYLVGNAVGSLLGVALFVAMIAYFTSRGDREYRSARASWIAAWFIVLGVAPWMFVAQRLDQRQEGEKMLAIVKSMSGQFEKADRDYAEKLKPQVETAAGVLGSDRIADAAARAAARAALAAGIKTIDETLARWERIPEETIAQVRATAADNEAKEAVVAGIRAAAAGPSRLSVQMMKGTRAFLLKTGEIIAHVNQYAAGVTVREGRLEFADSAVADIYAALQSELEGLQQELRRLTQQVQKPR